MSECGMHEEPSVRFEVYKSRVPNGWHLAEVKTSEMNEQQELVLWFRIPEGKWKGRGFPFTYALLAPNGKARQEARGDFSLLLRAVGVMQPAEASELYGKRLEIHLMDEKIDGFRPVWGMKEIASHLVDTLEATTECLEMTTGGSRHGDGKDRKAEGSPVVEGVLSTARRNINYARRRLGDD